MIALQPPNSRDLARRRLAVLAQQPALLGAEPAEVQALAEFLGVRVDLVRVALTGEPAQFYSVGVRDATRA